MIPSGQYRALQDALNIVAINAQAVAAADTCLGALSAVRERFSGLWTWFSPDRSRIAWRDGLDEAMIDVQRFRAPFLGVPQAPVVASEWYELRQAIGRAYNRLWAIEDVEGSEDSDWVAFVSWTGETVAGTIEAMPAVLKTAVQYVTHTAAEAATDVIGGAAAGLLPLWPLVVVAVVIAGAGAAVLAKAQQRGLIR